MNLITDYLNKNAKSNTFYHCPPVQDEKPNLPAVNNSQILKDEFRKEQKKDGLFEKFYNWLKNKTHFGTGSNTVTDSIDQYEKGMKTEQDVRQSIEKFRQSQKNGQQIFGDLFSATAAAGTYFGLTNFINKNLTLLKANNGKLTGFFEQFSYTKKGKNFIKNLNKGKVAAIGIIAAMAAGGIIKSSVLGTNRVVSKEFKYDKKNKPPKKERRQIKKAKLKEKFKDFATGALNGLFAPVIGIAGGIAGIPVFLAANFGARYFTASKDKKSVKDFKEKFKDNVLINTASIVLMTIPLWKMNRYSKILNKNLKIVAEKLNVDKLHPSMSNTKTAYSQIQSILLESESISKITGSSELNVSEQIIQLTRENIFAAKFLQISGEGKLSKTLKENCPSTRTLEQAQNFIAKTFGKKYEVSKQLGVGTIAETYLVRDTETGKDVCIKILKEGISLEKIQTDKLKIAELIKSQVQNPDEQQYLLKNLDDLASGIAKEVDFKNEMEAAKQIKKYTSKAKVVKPIEVKDNIYVMEKANGISLKTLQEYIALETQKFSCQKQLSRAADGRNKEYYENCLRKIEEELKTIRAKSPDFDLNGISNKQLKKMLREYISVMCEQLFKIGRNGKVLHGDIHPGNIFIDLDALKAGKGKVLTLIDLGNTVTLSKLQAQNALKLTQYIHTGNVKDITKYVLDGAVLPDGLTKENAVEIMEKELNKAFFDCETSLKSMTNNNLLELNNNIMREHGILPSGTQVNFERATKNAKDSFEVFANNFFDKKYSAIDIDDMNKAERLKIGGKAVADILQIGRYFLEATWLQQIKNLYQTGYIFKRNPNALKTNSEKYLIYKFKQKLYKPDRSSIC